MNAPACLHCSTPIPPALAGERFCCRGCAAVYALLHEGGLARWYELAPSRTPPAALAADPPAAHAWLEPILEASKPGAELQLDVQGIHCSACVWLLQETFRRETGAGSILVNPALGQVALRFDRTRFDLLRWIRAVERFGYRFGPARKSATRRSLELPLRLGVSAALTINTMLFSVAFYFGLAPDEPEIFRLFSYLALALSTAVVAIGGWPFFRSALLAVRRGVLHLDLPIALGIALVYLMSLIRMRGASGFDRGDLAYFDTLDVFVTLMLAGRLLQERLLERNRRLLLEDDGVAGLVARRITGESLAVVPASAIAAGDRLQIAPGELVPVDGTLLAPDVEATVSTDWIDGESQPTVVAPGGAIAAGSFNAGRRAFVLAASTAFSSSPLVDRLREVAPRAATRTGPAALWDRLARAWVAAVFTGAALGLALWWPLGRERALAVAAALLVVTCPCAIGIALPLARELSLRNLRRAGCFVRSADALDRLAAVRRILFDKTGTLTLGRLELADRTPLDALAPRERELLWNLAVRSAHPAARALVDELDRGSELSAPRFDATLDVVEEVGRGVELDHEGARWRLGRVDWAADGAADDERATAFTKNGVLLARFALVERIRPDARAELARLATDGHELWLVSGDERERVVAVARELGIASERTFAACTPEAKALLVRGIDHDDTLFLGDGVNDAPAFAAASIAGTPAIERAVMPARSDFFLAGESLAPLGEAFAVAHAFQRHAHRLIVFSAVYNLVAIGAALAGLVTPLVAAVVMPASTLTLVALTVAAFEPARRSERPVATPPRLAEVAP